MLSQTQLFSLFLFIFFFLLFFFESQNINFLARNKLETLCKICLLLFPNTRKIPLCAVCACAFSKPPKNYDYVQFYSVCSAVQCVHVLFPNPQKNTIMCSFTTPLKKYNYVQVCNNHKSFWYNSSFLNIIQTLQLLFYVTLRDTVGTLSKICAKFTHPFQSWHVINSISVNYVSV